MLLKFNKALKTLDKWHDALDKKQYEPLIKVWSGPKGTRRHLYKGAKSKRNHHFLSDGERRLGIIRDSLPETVNYFEQYPLWDLELCVRIAIDMGIKYPCDEEGEAYVLSTDFYCLETDLADNNLATKEVARTYKTLDSLDREIKHPVSVTRTLQKLELERRYYEDKQIPFVLETDHNVSVNCAYNLKWSKGCLKYIHEIKHHQQPFFMAFVEMASLYFETPLQEVIQRVSHRLGLSYDDGFGLFQWGIWSHQLPIDLDIKIDVFKPVPLLEVA